MATFVKITDQLIVQREKVLAVYDQYDNGWSRVLLDCPRASDSEEGPYFITVKARPAEVLSRLQTPVIREELDGADLVKP